MVEITILFFIRALNKEKYFKTLYDSMNVNELWVTKLAH